MVAIRLTKTNINAAASRLKSIANNAIDANKTNMVSTSEFSKFNGKGAASAKKFAAPAQFAAGWTDSAGKRHKASLVPLTIFNSTIDRTAAAVKKLITTQGDKKSPLLWSELPGNASETMKSFVRFAHAVKS